MSAAVISLRTPPQRWEEGLAFGDGVQGGMLAGNRSQERLLLNRQGLWLPAADPRRERGALAQLLPEVRRLVLAGEPAEAERVWLRGAKAAGWHFVYSDPCHPAGEVRFTPTAGGLFSGYRRAIDCAAGVVSAQWREADGATVSRTAFASRVDGAIVLAIAADRPGRISGSLGLGPVDLGNASIWFASTYPGIDAEGWKGHTVRVDQLLTIAVDAGAGWWHLRGDYVHGGGWGVVARLVATGGTVAYAGREANVVGCDRLVLLSAVYRGDHAQADVLRARLAALDADPVALRARHAEAHGALHARCRLKLGGEGDGRSGEELLFAAEDGELPPALVEHLHDLGRHLLISCAGGDEPPHLQGIWTGTWRPPWFGNYTQDENLQMMHWAAEPGRLGELVAPLLAHCARHRADWARNARELFGCGGLVAPLMQSGIDGRADCAEWHFFTSAAGWLATHAWDRWLHSGDLRVLRDDCLPLLEGVATFLADFLVDLGDGQLHAVPSLSVENRPLGWPARTTIDATMDIAVAREVLGRLITALAILGGEPARSERWQGLLARLPAYRIAADGALAEWIPANLADNHHHRHLSHLYPLFPGRELSAQATPALFAAARTALDRRRVVGVQSQTSWSHVHLAHAYARARSGADAAACLTAVVRACAMPNLLFTHDDRRGTGLAMGAIGGDGRWQLDASLGLLSLLYEMLLQSSEDGIVVLPAPAPAWRSGRVGPLATRCRVDVDLEWTAEHCDVRLQPAAGAPTREITLEPGPGWRGGGRVLVSPAGVTVRLMTG